jgi:uncharacterized membrane protein
MDLGRLSYGARIAGISAILLFAFMFFDWFGVRFSQNTNLLIFFQSVEPGKDAWDALNYIPIVLLITIIAALLAAALRATNAVHKSLVSADAVVAILGVISTLLILLRIIDPPSFGSFRAQFGTVTREGTIQFPIFLALLAAAGIAFGGCRALWEENISFTSLRQLRFRGQGPLRPRGSAPTRSNAPTDMPGDHASPNL